MPASPSSRPAPRRALRAAPLAGAVLAGAVLAGAAALAPAAAGAQLFGLPVVQSPFPGRPFALALDGGTASEGVRVGALAIAARRPAGRLAASLGIGRAQGFEAARTTYGGRLAYTLTFGEARTIGVAPFAGYGRVSGGDSARVAQSNDPRLARSLAIVPLGVGLGYQRAVAGRAVTLHVTPQAQLWRRGPAGLVTASSTWYGRAAVGADVGLTSQLGVSLAYERGGSSPFVTAGPRGNVFGLAASWAPARRRR